MSRVEVHTDGAEWSIVIDGIARKHFQSAEDMARGFGVDLLCFDTIEGQFDRVCQHQLKAKSILQKWVDQQGHNRCWYYPELFTELCQHFGVTPAIQPELPKRSEFEEGCQRFQDEQYPEPDNQGVGCMGFDDDIYLPTPEEIRSLAKAIEAVEEFSKDAGEDSEQPEV